MEERVVGTELSSCALNLSLMPAIAFLTREQISVADQGLVCHISGEQKTLECAHVLDRAMA